jgi:hypothetical protein
MTPRIRLAGLILDVPPGWSDIRRELPPDSPPTLGKADGVGVIQFSVARYRSGKVPVIRVSDLREMLEDFCAANRLEPSASLSEGVGRDGNLFVRADLVDGDEQIVAWYVGNGSDVALVTYVTQESAHPAARKEIDDASHVVERLAFDRA